VTCETKGYWFRTPEAWDSTGNFRALMYMRPAAIWAMEMLAPPEEHSAPSGRDQLSHRNGDRNPSQVAALRGIHISGPATTCWTRRRWYDCEPHD
jgi:familyl 116 glycosyl hydrolase-like protein